MSDEELTNLIVDFMVGTGFPEKLREVAKNDPEVIAFRSRIKSHINSEVIRVLDRIIEMDSEPDDIHGRTMHVVEISSVREERANYEL